jgi:hypothetical protein
MNNLLWKASRIVTGQSGEFYALCHGSVNERSRRNRRKVLEKQLLVTDCHRNGTSAYSLLGKASICALI